MSAQAVYAALTTGAMKAQTVGLSTQEVIALLVYIAPAGGTNTKPAFEKSCTGGAGFTGAIGGSAPSWPGWSPSVTNARYQEAKAAGLTAADVPKLKLKWAFSLGEVPIARGQPVVAGNRLFVTTLAGDVYAVDTASGCIQWAFRATAGVNAGVTLGEANGMPALFFGDRSAVMYALNAESGELLWKTRPVEHQLATATATPQFYKGVIYQGFSSLEEALAVDPNTACCSFRGSIAAIDAATGRALWQSFTIPEPAKPTGRDRDGRVKSQGPSGAAIWSTPTIDEPNGAIYAATGDNYSNPVTNTSDAVLAFELTTGKLLWSRQLTQGDAYNSACNSRTRANCPVPDGPDFDFGQPPILVTLNAPATGGARRALVIAQKSGRVHALDPDAKGKILWQTRVGAGGLLGGSQWGSAADSQRIYVAISDVVPLSVADPASPTGRRIALDPKMGGGLHAINLRSGVIAWSARPTRCAAAQAICSPAQSAAVTAIPGAVFSGSLDGHLRAYSTATGRVIWDFDTAREFQTVNGKVARGGSIDATGAAVAGGLVFLNSGYSQFGGMPGNVLLAFSVDGQ